MTTLERPTAALADRYGLEREIGAGGMAAIVGALRALGWRRLQLMLGVRPAQHRDAHIRWYLEACMLFLTQPTRASCRE